MIRRSRLRLATVPSLWVSLVLIACVDEPPSSIQRSGLPEMAPVESRALARPQTLREEWREIAQRNPGFAGLSFGVSGDLVVSDTSESLV